MIKILSKYKINKVNIYIVALITWWDRGKQCFSQRRQVHCLQIRIIWRILLHVNCYPFLYLNTCFWPRSTQLVHSLCIMEVLFLLTSFYFHSYFLILRKVGLLCMYFSHRFPLVDNCVMHIAEICAVAIMAVEGTASLWQPENGLVYAPWIASLSYYCSQM